MRFEFRDAFLETLAFDPTASSPWPLPVLALYRRRLQQIRAARTIRDLLAARALDAEQVQHRGAAALSLRIDDAHRLVVRVQEGDPEGLAIVLDVRSTVERSTDEA